MSASVAVSDGHSPGWREEAAAWVAECLAARSIQPKGHLVACQSRPWAMVQTIETSGGRLYFKAVVGALVHEVRLHQALFTRHPSYVPALVGAEPSRGWLLMKDAGAPLRQSIHHASEAGRFAPVLGRLAEMQLAWLEDSQALLDLGVLDRRPRSLPDAFSRLINDPDALAAGQPEGITQEEHRRLHDLAPRVEALCHQLTAWGPPPTLHHDDFHDANVYAHDGDLRLADWGEAGVGHPFFTAMIAFRSLCHRLRLAPNSPELEALKTGYLEAWEAFGPADVLRLAFDLAQRLSAVSRALTWHKVMSSLPPELRGDDAAAAAGWLRTALDWLEP